MQQFIEAGSVATVLVNVVDENGDHVAATISTTTTRLQKGTTADTTWNSAAPTVDTIATGVYRIKFTGLSPEVSLADNDDQLRCAINGDVASTAWTEYHLPLRVVMSNTSSEKLEASAGQIIKATVDTVTNTHTPTTTEFQADDITEATADHYKGRVVVFTSGVLAGQSAYISSYAAVGGIGQFTVPSMTDAPSNNDTFIIV